MDAKHLLDLDERIVRGDGAEPVHETTLAEPVHETTLAPKN